MKNLLVAIGIASGMTTVFQVFHIFAYQSIMHTYSLTNGEWLWKVDLVLFTVFTACIWLGICADEERSNG